MTDEVAIAPVGTAKIRYRQNSYWVTITAAMERLGETGGSLLYDVGAVEETGLLPALWSDEAVDGRRSSMGRAISVEGNDVSPSYRVRLPQECIEALGFDVDEVHERSEAGNPVSVELLAGEGLIAFEPPKEQRIAVDRDSFGES